MRFLSVMVDEFERSNKSKNMKCKSPYSTDQGILNYLYYTGRFGRPNSTKTIPWGTGPVNTMGKACVKDGEHSASDLVMLDPKTDQVVNLHEEEASPFRIPAVLHQYDRCHKWIRPWIRKHEDELRPG